MKKMRPEDINDRHVNLVVEKLMKGESVLSRFCQTCRQPQLAEEGLKCRQCGAEDLTKKTGEKR